MLVDANVCGAVVNTKRHLKWFLVCMLMAACLPNFAFGQGIIRNLTDANASQGVSGSFFDAGNDHYMWLRHVEGQQVGDTEAFTSFGRTGFRTLDNGVVMFTGQLLITNNAAVNLSAGGHRRIFVGDSLVGFGVNFDAIQTDEGNWFQQTAFSTEWFRDNWTLRGNFNLPVGSDVQLVEVYNQGGGGNNQPFFFGNNIAVGQFSNQLDEVAMQAIDIEIARSIGNLPAEAFCGYYHLEGKIGPDTDGIKGGVRGYVTPRLAGNVEVADDSLFGTNVYGGFTWFFGGNGANAPRSIEDKLTIPVERNQQVIVNRVATNVFLPTVILTDQGQPITVSHINSGGTGGNGSINSPFRTLTDADNDPNKNNRDIVYVHSGSIFNNESFALAPNQRFLGEGDNNNHFVNTDQLGVIVLPQVNGNQFPRPIINGGTILGNDNTQISNFRFQNASPGIQLNGLSGNADVNRAIFDGATGIDIIGGSGQFTFSDVQITNAGMAAIRANAFAGNVNANRISITGGDTGIDIIGGSGQFTFSDTSVESQLDTGVRVNGGNSGITFDQQTGIVQSTGGTGVRVGGGHDGTITFDPGSTIDSTAGDGLQFDDADGQYDFRGQVQLSGGDAGIDILGDSAGTFTFTNTEITNPTGDGLNINGGSSTVLFDGSSSISKNTPTGTVRVGGGHTGRLTFNPGTGITSTNGTGLQFDDADGIYDFRGQVQLNGGDAGIDILGDSAGTFTFTNTDITNPSGTGINIEGGSSTVNFDGLSSLTKNNSGSSVRVAGGHTGTLTFHTGTITDATAGIGLQFDNADGIYDFRGNVTLNGGDAGIDILGDSDGTFTFTDTDITSPNGTGVNIDGGSSDVTFSVASSVTKTNTGSAVRVWGGHDGRLIFDTGTDITATDGNGLQFDDADGTYDFRGNVTLNGGDAGIDILNDSAGTFTFSSDTTITNPTGTAFRVFDLAAGGSVNYNGSIESNNDTIINIDRTAPGTSVNFNSNGGNSLTSTDNPNGAMFIFDADGDITITTPMTVTRPGFSSLFATDGDGTWTFNDLTIVDQIGLNGGVDVFGNMGVVNFTNINITTDSAGTGDATTGFLAGGNREINVFGNSNIDADGGAAIALINVDTIDITFNNVTTTNNLNSQIGFAGDDGIDLLNVGAGTLDITGTTTIRNVDGVGISVEDSGATMTFANVDIDMVGLDGIISGVAFDNPGIVNVNGGSISNTGGDGIRIGSGGFGSGVLGGFFLNNTTITNAGGSVVNLSNSVVGGSGNIAPVFTCTDLGGNTGMIFFNGGADSCPN